MDRVPARARQAAKGSSAEPKRKFVTQSGSTLGSGPARTGLGADESGRARDSATFPRCRTPHGPALIRDLPRLHGARKTAAVLCHHAAFDGLILSHHF